MTIDHISDVDHGRYFVNTEASTYQIDLEEHTIIRRSNANAMRGDARPVALLSIGRCEVGASALFYLDGLAERGETVRSTTIVQSIEAVA